ncbi:CpaF family protein, partial [Salmonella enterica subsp. enterica serovar Newport]|nr:CpaF family protein [Salmonella enterica subsp. enterica serovar Newport]
MVFNESYDIDVLKFFRETVFRRLDLDRVDAVKNDRTELEEEVNNVLQQVSLENGQFISNQVQQEIIKMICDEISGYGPLNDLMEDDSISDILINGPDQIYVEIGGKLEKSSKFFLGNQQLTDIARRLVSKVGRR